MYVKNRSWAKYHKRICKSSTVWPQRLTICSVPEGQKSKVFSVASHSTTILKPPANPSCTPVRPITACGGVNALLTLGANSRRGYILVNRPTPLADALSQRCFFFPCFPLDRSFAFAAGRRLTGVLYTGTAPKKSQPALTVLSLLKLIKSPSGMGQLRPERCMHVHCHKSRRRIADRVRLSL